MKVVKSEQEWKSQLSPEAFYVCRQHGTEAPFSGTFYTNSTQGTYSCICCGEALFESDTKFDSGTGWPSYYESIEDAVTEIKDSSLGMIRIEVRCASCDAHLGHVFPDGPEPTGLRYCINSVCLDFEEK
ncbi:MAG TPA: peptide-methionine (R)-S-oxide reductase [Sulfurimonas sp. UBA12504]|nr:MAG: peptide-methionine (R)-S-oxide reductase [Sulfurimonas sp. GWF2_37_8]DAB29033.1 MAG TPA: peptide-methionine (R)-S-oxide reductase [Sulfurimonas sp. UBA12504]